MEYTKHKTLKSFLDCIQVKSNSVEGKTRASKKVNSEVLSFDIETNNTADSSVIYGASYAFGITDSYLSSEVEHDFMEFIRYAVTPPKDEAYIKRHSREKSAPYITLYSHNLQYEWIHLQHIIEQFVQESKLTRVDYEVDENGCATRITEKVKGKRSTDFNVFYRDKQILKVQIKNFRWQCSYALSNQSLAVLTRKNVHFTKQEADDMHTKGYNSLAEVSDKDKYYMECDTLALNEALQNMADDHNLPIWKLPLTQTGFTRLILKEELGVDTLRYIRTLKMTTEDYTLFEKVKHGGLTGVAYNKDNRTYYYIGHEDITSSYPFQIMLKEFPTSNFTEIKECNKISKADLIKLCEKYCILGDFEITNLRIKDNVGIPSIFSNKTKGEGVKLYNGKVVEADKLTLSMTNVDIDIMRLVYNFDTITPLHLRYAQKGYLPNDIREAILEAYKTKCEVESGTPDYVQAKEILNAIYGVMCTNPIMEENTMYKGEFINVQDDRTLQEKLDEVNNSRKRNYFYAWGIWTAALGRKQLVERAVECGSALVYYDTDSVFYEEDKLPEGFKTSEGVKKELGSWEYDHYKAMRAVCAKRYAVITDDDDIEFTCAGISKKVIKQYFADNNLSLDNLGDDDIVIPKEVSNKLCSNTHTDGTKSWVNLKPVAMSVGRFDLHKRVAMYDYNFGEAFNMSMLLLNRQF